MLKFLESYKIIISPNIFQLVNINIIYIYVERERVLSLVYKLSVITMSHNMFEIMKNY